MKKMKRVALLLGALCMAGQAYASESVIINQIQGKTYSVVTSGASNTITIEGSLVDSFPNLGSPSNHPYEIHGTATFGSTIINSMVVVPAYTSSEWQCILGPDANPNFCEETFSMEFIIPPDDQATGTYSIDLEVIDPADTSTILATGTDTFDFTLFSGILTAGLNTVSFHDITLPNSGFQTCAQASPNVTGIKGSVWDEAFTDGSASLCVVEGNVKKNGTVDLTLNTGTLDIGDVHGSTSAGIGYTLTDTILGPSAITYAMAVIELPDGVTIHEPMTFHPVNTTERPSPRGSSELNIVSAGSVNTPDNIILEMDDIKYLYSYGLPSYIAFLGLVIDFDNNDGVSFTVAGSYHTDLFHYLYMSVYESGDSRFYNRLPSNNSPFFLGTFSELRLNGSGLQGTLSMDNSGADSITFNTAYPKGQISWGEFTTTLVDGTIQPTTIPNVDFSMSVSGTCPEGECGNNSPVKTYAFNNVTLGVGEDCALGGLVADSGHETTWGKFNGSRHTFEKDDTGRRGMLFFPGSFVPKSEASPGNDEVYTISDYLFGSRAFTGATTLGEHAYLDDDNDHARNGNNYFAGLTIGPQTLFPSVSTNLTDLIDATDLSLLFNGETTPITFDVTDYTKYVIRPGGITGVFNTGFLDTVSIYGYVLNLSRFAFRQDVNELDDESFIDGHLDLPHPADLTVGFTSLELTCTGDMAGGQVDPENSGDSLAYWNTPIDLLGMGFEDTNGSSICPDPNNRQLKLDSANQVNGLSNLVTLNAFWSPAGEPSQDTMTSAVAQHMDTPAEGDDTGFSVVLRDGYLYHDSNYAAPTVTGFTNLNLLVDVPLFDDMPVLGHFQNDDDTAYSMYLSKDDQTADSDMNGIPDTGYESLNLTQYRDELTKDDASLTQDPRPEANYSWAGLVNLSYPLLYDRSGTDKGPQFRGIKQVKNLPGDTDPVIVITSVPDYLKPDTAKVSFGATADVAELKNFHVDMSSLTGDLDNFLSSQLNVSLPIEGLLSDMVSSTGAMHEVTGGDITELFKPVLDTALDTPVVENAFGALSDVMRELHRAPGLLTSQLENRINDTRDSLISSVSSELTQQVLNQLYTTNLAIYITYDAQALEDSGLISASDLLALESDMASVLSSIGHLQGSVDGLKGQLSSIRSMLESLRGDITTSFARVSTTVSDVNGGLSTLSDYTSTDMATNPLLTEVNDAKTKLESAMTAIKNLDIGQIGDALKQGASLAGADIDTSMIDDADAFFDARVAELEQLIRDAETQLESALGSLGLGSVFSEAQNRITYVETHLTTLNGHITTVFDLVLGQASNPSDVGYLGSLDDGLSAVSGFIQGFEQSLSQARISTLDSTDLDVLRQAGQSKLDQLAASLISDLSSAGGDLGTAASMILSGIELDDPQNAFENVFRNGLSSLLTAPLDQITGNMSASITAVTDQALSFIPDASADDLKEMVKGAILNSAPIQNLNTTFHQQFGFIGDAVDDLSGDMVSKINGLINEAVAAVSEELNNQLASVSSNVGGTGDDVSAAKMDGYAIISQDELMRIHIDAEYQFGGKPKPTTYYAMLDITNWNADNGKGSACPSDVGGESMFDVVISTKDVKAEMLGTDIGIKTASLGFTFEGLAPIGIFGNVYTSGELSFEAVKLKDMGLEAGIGSIENYLGAKATGKFDSYTISAVFFFGKTCDFEVLKRLDKDIEDFIGTQSAFTGVYVRGGADIPIFNYGCFLKVGVGAEVGAWYLTEPTPIYGGMFGGSAYGRVACLAALKGKVRLSGSKIGDQYRFYGMGWGAGGIGFCSPGSWDSVSDSRSDSWCVTGDATFEATYTNGWSISGPDVNCCY